MPASPVSDTRVEFPDIILDVDHGLWNSAEADGAPLLACGCNREVVGHLATPLCGVPGDAEFPVEERCTSR